MSNTTIAFNRAEQTKHTITNSQLIVWAFASAFFPRLLDLAGAPAIINFVHFFTVPFTCVVILLNCNSRNKQQIATIKSLVLGLFILFSVLVVSALVNQAGFINVAIDFMLLGEPFILLLAIVGLSINSTRFLKLKQRLYAFFWFHLASIYIQKYILRVDTWEWLGMVGHDRIQGVFLLSGAGHVVGASVSMTVS